MDGITAGSDSVSDMTSGRMEDAEPNTASDAAGTRVDEPCSAEDTNNEAVAEAFDKDTVNDFVTSAATLSSPLLSSLTLSQIF